MRLAESRSSGPNRSEPGRFPAGAAIRKIDSETVLLLGGPRALLLQLAHPLVARAVAEHSGFEEDPFARLRRTLEASFEIVFGTDERAQKVAARVKRVHARVSGDGYRADDPELLLWVHSTLVDTALRVHRLFLHDLADAEAEEYYQQSMTVAELLGVPRRVQPEDLYAFRDYMQRMVTTLEVSDTARRLSATVLHPPVPIVAEPVFVLVRHLTIGLLPAPIRAGYGLTWDPARRLALGAALRTSRAVLPHVPTSVRRVRVFS